MEIGNTAQAASSGATSNTSSVQSGSALSSDFETFIKMLTTQMENQDPLNPIDSADFAVQLATFSSVEQQVLTNDLLSNLNTQLGLQSVAQLAGWVGMEAKAKMPAVFEGVPIELTLPKSDLAQSAELVVSNNRGTEVQRLSVPTDGGEYVWSGVDSFGNPLPNGTYQLEVEFESGGEVISTSAAEVYARILEASTENASAILVMSNGQRVAANDITSIREYEE